jgi:glycosyltransferase involved in cell wall biosynthesis
MIFSFVVPYRNREIARVSNCLQSIRNQSFTDFEIIFIDYGSESEMQIAIENLCNQFPQRLSYFYIDSRYQFWSRSHAINLGIVRAQGDFVVVVDIDLIYPPDFLTLLKNKIDEKSFVQYQCYYLPESMRDYEQLDFQKLYPYQVSSTDMAAGLIAFPKQKIYELGGYDEYFKVWGVEDLDLKKRLKAINLAGKVLSISECPTFHQWHASAANEELMPALWLVAMEKYAKMKPSSPLSYLNLASENTYQRPALALLQSKMASNFTFDYPTLLSFSKFSKVFFALRSGDYLFVNQTFTMIKIGEKSRLGGLFSMVNLGLERLGIFYRVTELFTFETEVVSFINVRDFMFYFIAENQDSLADYAFDIVFGKEIKCVLIKK